jgi:H/ACA ribonucleoprotein complex subunit 4
MEVAVHKKTKVEAKDGEDYSIKPQAVTPSIDTSSWPLLLKNYDKRKCWIWLP